MHNFEDKELGEVVVTFSSSDNVVTAGGFSFTDGRGEKLDFLTSQVNTLESIATELILIAHGIRKHWTVERMAHHLRARNPDIHISHK